ncbi:hypothetical protein SE17_31665 [Kouleothrix aurantiaca]|uniref:Guanylate cyclase domain-containing protein n=1 Tax=Kouleothrix aurantiaca TaxID=186479 RepID=A0A0P9DAK2_9CHLR|nr:hypothetical protein SE17_31665 [Kouleothrix aurantiaca]
MPSRADIEQTIAAIELRRATLGDALTDAALAPLRQQLAALDEQRKQVTVLFADMAGFTATAETMDPEDVRDVIRAYFGRLSEAITRYGGWIEKFIGGAVMAVFGIPTANERDPEHALRAALAMHASLAELNTELERERGIRLAMRIGINTGPALVGNIGSAELRNFTAIGDTVNLAARLETSAESGQIVIGANTRAQLGAHARVRPLGGLALKGKAAPVEAFVLEGLDT